MATTALSIVYVIELEASGRFTIMLSRNLILNCAALCATECVLVAAIRSNQADVSTRTRWLVGTGQSVRGVEESRLMRGKRQEMRSHRAKRSGWLT